GTSELLPALAAVNAAVLRSDHHESVRDVGIEAFLFPGREPPELAVTATVEEDQRQLFPRCVLRFPEIAGNPEPVAEIGDPPALESLIGFPPFELFPREQTRREGREGLHGDAELLRLLDFSLIAPFRASEPSLIGPGIGMTRGLFDESAIPVHASGFLSLENGRNEKNEEQADPDHGGKSMQHQCPTASRGDQPAW